MPNCHDKEELHFFQHVSCDSNVFLQRQIPSGGRMTCNQCLKEFFSHGDVCPNCVEKNNRMDEWYQRENEKIEKKYRREDF